MQLFGCPVDALTMAETVRRVEEIVQASEPVQHCALNAAGVVALRDDARLLDIVRECGLVSADGQALVWASHLLGQPVPERVAGPDLFLALIGLAEARGWPVYLMGATPQVLEKTCVVLSERHPKLRIAGCQDGYFSDDESDVIAEDIRGSGARMLFVAMPTPKKEYWISEHLSSLGVPFCMGVGGTYDIVSGVVRRAPTWVQRAGLEWAYRLYREPSRMWRRYVIGNTRFIGIVMGAMLRRVLDDKA